MGPARFPQAHGTDVPNSSARYGFRPWVVREGDMHKSDRAVQDLTPRRELHSKAVCTCDRDSATLAV